MINRFASVCLCILSICAHSHGCIYIDRFSPKLAQT